MPPSSPTVSVVIPVLNEENTLPLVLEHLPPVDEVIVVDGGSTDDTVAVAREVRPDAHVVRQTRAGRGNALICGFAAAAGDIVITLNADGSTDPGEIPRYVDALLSGAEVAHGSRYREGGDDLRGRKIDSLGNTALRKLVNTLFGTRFTDLGYGYNAYWRELLPALDLPAPMLPGLPRGATVWGDGPEIEPLINIRMAAQGLRVVEVASIGYPPIHPTHDEAHTRRAWRAIRAAATEYTRRRRIGERGPLRYEEPERYSRSPAIRPAPRRPGESGTWSRALLTRDTPATDTPSRTTRAGSIPTGGTLAGGTPAAHRDIPVPARRRAIRDAPAPYGQDDMTIAGHDDREQTGSRPLYPERDPREALPGGRHAAPAHSDPPRGQTTGRRALRSDTAETPGRRIPPPDPGQTTGRWVPPWDTGQTTGRRVPPWDTGQTTGRRSSPWDTGAHHRIETESWNAGDDWRPDADRDHNGIGAEASQHEVGGRRRRLDPGERRDGRPDLTVITGEGTGRHGRGGRLRAVRDDQDDDRAVPGERWNR